MGKINSRSKGKRGELEWRDVLRTHGIQARRGAQFQGGVESPDVVSEDMPGWHVEVKRNECLQLYPAMEQAIRDSKNLKTPYVAHRRNGKPWVVVLLAEDFLRLLQQSGLTAGLSPTPSQAAPLNVQPTESTGALTVVGLSLPTTPTQPTVVTPTSNPVASVSPASPPRAGTGRARSARRSRSTSPGSATTAPHDGLPPGETTRS